MQKIILEVYLDATADPFGYLSIDFSPGNKIVIFPAEHTIIYK